MPQFPFARHCSVRLYLGWLIHIWCSPGSSGGKYKSDNWGIFGQSQAYQGGLVRLLDTESIFLSFLWQTLGNAVIMIMMMFRQLDIDVPRVLSLTIISFHLHHNSPPISQLWPQLMSVTHVMLLTTQILGSHWSGLSDPRRVIGQVTSTWGYPLALEVWGPQGRVLCIGNEDNEDYSALIIIRIAPPSVWHSSLTQEGWSQMKLLAREI